jgi:hypothetical protein
MKINFPILPPNCKVSFTSLMNMVQLEVEHEISGKKWKGPMYTRDRFELYFHTLLEQGMIEVGLQEDHTKPVNVVVSNQEGEEPEYCNKHKWGDCECTGICKRGLSIPNINTLD